MSVPANPSTPFYAGLPVLFDVADGVTPYPPFGSPTGVPTAPVGTPNVNGTLQAAGHGVVVGAKNGTPVITGNQIEEMPDSPEIERAEQCTCTKRFRMPYDYAVFLISYMGRGTVLADNENRYLRILSTQIKREKPNMAILTIVSEALSFDLPPDEFSIEPIELGAGIMKYPRYFYALMPADTDTPEQSAAKQAIIRAIQTYMDSPFFPTSSSLNGILSGQIQDNIAAQLSGGKSVIRLPNENYDPNITTTEEDSWPVQTLGAITYPDAPKANGDVNPPCVLVAVNKNTADVGSPDPVIQAAFCAAQEILTKLWKQEDAPYQVACQVTWSTYYYIKPDYNPGGYIEDPIYDLSPGNPGLPAYFGSSNFDYATGTIFDNIYQYNPQCYSSDGTALTGQTSMSWLRKADVVNYERTWFKVTRTWIGSPQAHWDADLYNQKDRPASASYSDAATDFGFNVDGKQTNPNQP